MVLVAGSQPPPAQSMPGLVAVGKVELESGAAPGAVQPVSVKPYVVEEVAELFSATWPTSP